MEEPAGSQKPVGRKDTPPDPLDEPDPDWVPFSSRTTIRHVTGRRRQAASGPDQAQPGPDQAQPGPDASTAALDPGPARPGDDG